jgi:hypothetical protein
MKNQYPSVESIFTHKEIDVGDILRRAKAKNNNPDEIYLAGKVGGQKWTLVESIPPVVGWVSSDGSKHSEHKWGRGPLCFSPDLKEAVVEEVIEPIKRCKYLVAYLDTPSSYGSIAEISYASAIGKESLVFVNTGGTSIEPDWCPNDPEPEPERHRFYREMYDAYWFVTSFPKVRLIEVADINTAREVLNDWLQALYPKAWFNLKYAVGSFRLLRFEDGKE